MIIRRPTEKDLPRLSQIWQQAFGDGAEDVEHFYTTAFCYDRCLVAVHQTAVACIYWMDTQMAGRKIAYLYAFGVDAPCRSQGVGKALLEKTLETLKEEGYAGAVLVPGEESLYGYYEKQGFAPFGKAKKTVIKKKAPGLPITKADGKTYFAKRQSLCPAVQWTQEAFSYLETFCDLYIGEDWVLALGREGVQEYLGTGEDLPHILYTLNIESAPVSLSGEDPCAMSFCFEEMSLPDTFSPSF